MKTRKSNSLASIVESILKNSSETGVSAKETLQTTQSAAKELNLTIIINYRAVYQQLKNLGQKVSKGRFVFKQVNTQDSEAA